MAENGHGVQIQCQCHLKDGKNVGIVSKWHHKAIGDFNGDHVFLWYDPYHFGSIRHFFSTISFEFRVTSDSGEHDNFFSIKECGIYPIYISEFPMLLDKLNYEDGIKSYLRGRVKSDLEMLSTQQRFGLEFMLLHNRYETYNSHIFLFFCCYLVL